MKLWPVAPFLHSFYPFWLGLLLPPPKSDKKNEKKGQLPTGQSFFFDVTSYKIHTLVVDFTILRNTSQILNANPQGLISSTEYYA